MKQQSEIKNEKLSVNNTKLSTKKGFTMIEMIITITLVIILSLISTVIYRPQDKVYHAKVAEGYALLGKLRDAQMAYYNEYGNFLRNYDAYGKGVSNLSYYLTCYDPVLNLSCASNKYFTCFNYLAIDTPSTLAYFKAGFSVSVRGKGGQMYQTFNLSVHSEPTLFNIDTSLSI